MSEITVPSYGNRQDGSRKGPGFLGELKRPDGSVSTELSIGVNLNGQEMEIPSLVPTLHPLEINHLLQGNKPTRVIVNKAIDHAQSRILKGLPVFQEGNASNAGLAIQLTANDNPDAAAKDTILARNSGVPVGLVNDFRDEYVAKDKVNNAMPLLNQNPKLSNFLSQDLNRAKISNDSIENLASMENKYGAFRSIDRSFIEEVTQPFMRGFASFKKGFAINLQESGLMAGYEKQRAAAAKQGGASYTPQIETENRLASYQRVIESYPTPEKIQRGLEEIHGAEGLKDATKAIFQNPTSVREVIFQSLGTYAPVLAMAAATRSLGPMGASTVAPFFSKEALRFGATIGFGSFATEYASSLDEAISNKAGDLSVPGNLNKVLTNEKVMEEARGNAVKRGLSVAAFDMVTGTVAGKLLSGATSKAASIAPRIAGEGLIQAGGGAAGEATAQFAANEKYNPGAILLEAFAELPTALVEAPFNYRSMKSDAERAEKSGAILEDLNKLVMSDKVLKRDKETFSEWIKQATEDGPVENVYILAKTLKQANLADKLMEVSPSVKGQFTSAMASDGEIQIPIAEYLTNIAPTELSGQILNDLRVDGDTMTKGQATVFLKNKSEELQTAYNSQIEKYKANEVFAKSANEVQDIMFQQLKQTGRYADPVSRINAQFVRDFVVTQAANQNVMPMDFFNKYMYKVTAEGQAAFNQDAVAATDIISQTQEFKDWFGNSVVKNAEGKPTVLFHGTSDNVTDFDPDHPNRKDTGWLGTGAYLTDSTEAADLYAQQKAKGITGQNVMPVYARLENPYTATKEEKAAVKAGGRAAADAFTKKLMDAGHDGVIYQMSPDAKEIVVFNPAGVKSVFNEGTWSLETKNLLKQPKKPVDIKNTYVDENRVGIVLGTGPGVFGWHYSNGEIAPPISAPTPIQGSPNAANIGRSVASILSSTKTKKLIEELFGITNLKAIPINGMWKGSEEASFILTGDGMDFDSANKLSKFLGLMMAQEVTLVTQPTSAVHSENIPAFYMGYGQKLTPEQLSSIANLAKEQGINYSTTSDGRAIKVLYFGKESGLNEFSAKIEAFSVANGFTQEDKFKIRSNQNDTGSISSLGGSPLKIQGSGTGPSDLFRRSIDNILAPYAKAVAAEGYRFSTDRFADRFGLSDQEREYVRTALYPKKGADLSTAGIIDGTETLDVAKSSKAKKPKATNNDIMFALQNRAGAIGQIEPGDYSAAAQKIISEGISSEIISSLSTPTGKSAVGWYDRALKAAKKLYYSVFPAMQSNDNIESFFNAVLGIASQGADVFTNSTNAGRMNELILNQGMTISKAISALYGTFGKDTRAIENNYEKLEFLLKQVGKDKLRAKLSKTKTVGEWNKIFREDKSLHFGGEKIELAGKADQKVTGWMAFGPKIGSFINNLSGDYSTLTADLWFSRTWNRFLGYVFVHTPQAESHQYDQFRRAVLAEASRTTEPKSVAKDGTAEQWEHGEDLAGYGYNNARQLPQEEIDQLVADPDAMFELATYLEDMYRKGFDYTGGKGDGYSTKSDLRRAAKNWIEGRKNSVALPRTDSEREFQQSTMEIAQKIIKRKTGIDITIADMQAVLWYHEKELFGKLGSVSKKAKPADYEDAAREFVNLYNSGDLFLGVDGKYLSGSKGSYLKKDKGGLLKQPVQGQEDARGGFDPTTLTTILGTEADNSTFLHETAHFFLSVYADMAANPNATEQSKQDMQTILDWFGVKDLATWNQMSLDEQRKYHEQFAYNYEIYLFEGKAPNIKLQTIFDRFSAWLARVYKSIRDDLNAIYRQEHGTDLPILTGEVRQVMDRMLATSEQIKQTETVRNMVPIFQTQEQSGMDDSEWAAYQEMSQEATNAAIGEMQTASLRQMKWLSGARSRVLKEMQKETAEIRKSLRDKVVNEVMADPVYRAITWIRSGETVGADGSIFRVDGGHLLSFNALTDMYGDAAEFSVPGFAPVSGMFDWSGLKSKKLVTGKGTLHDGIHPDIVAEMFGFKSGDDLVRALVSARKFNDEVNVRTDERMLAEHAELQDPKSIEVAVESAIHNEARARFVSVELRHLAKATAPVRVMLEAARQAAVAILASRPIGTIKPKNYAIAEARAAQEAINALKKGDTAGAMEAKRNQLLNNQLASEAIKVNRSVAKSLDLFKKVFTADSRIADKRDMNLVSAARAILANYGLGKTELPAGAYLAKVQEYDPEFYAEIEPMITAHLQQAKPITELTTDQFTDLSEQIQALWHLSRRSKQMEIDGKMVDRNLIVSELVDRIDVVDTKKERRGYDKAMSDWDKRKIMLMGARAAMRRVESWVDAMDAGKLDGPFRKYIWNPISEAVAEYRIAKNEYLQKYLDIVKSVEKGLSAGSIAAGEIGYTFKNKAELLHAILHTGNESNKRKMLLGRGWAEENQDGSLNTTRWDNFMSRMYAENRLSKVDFDFAQSVWDLLEEMKPAAQKVHKDMYGFYFNEISANPVITPFGIYRGGYVPAVTDPWINTDAAMRNEQETGQTDNSYMFPTTGRGFTKGRVEYNKPLMLDLGYFPSHLDKVLRFTYIEPKIKDVAKIVKTSQTFSAAMDRLDPTIRGDMLVPWLQRTAMQMIKTPMKGWGGKAMDKIFSEVRTRTGMQMMVGNVTNALQQVTGLSIGALKVKQANLRNALWLYIRQPADTSAMVAEKSKYMNTRMSSQQFEITKTIDELLLNPSKYDKLRSFADKHGYFMQQGLQNAVDTIVWVGAYNQSMAETGNEKDAVRAADSAVRLTQGSFAPEDVSRFETGNAFVRAFTMFYSYFNMQANLLGTEFSKSVKGLGVRKGMGQLLYIYTFGFMIPAVLSEVIIQAAGGFADGDDDEWDQNDAMSLFFGSQFRTALAMVPLVGQTVTASVNMLNSKPYDDRISTSPAIAALEAVARAPGSVYRAIAEDGSWKKGVRDLLTALGMITGLPLGQMGKPLGYAADIAQGRANPESAMDVTRGVISGKDVNRPNQ